MMTDLQISQSDKIGLSGTLGTEDTYFTPTTGAFAWATANTATAAEVAALTPNSNRKGMAVANGTSYTFCIPLIHPLFCLSEKYFPSFALADDTRLEFTWSTYVNALVGATAFTISNPEILVDYIEFDSSVFPLIQQTYAGSELIIPAQDYHYYASVLPTSAGNFSQIIPAKMQSCRAFFFAPRPAETKDVDAYSVSSRINPFYTAGDQFNLNIGGSKVPQHPIRTRVAGNHAEWFASTQTALHAFNSIQMNGNLNRTYYGKTAAQTGHEVGATSFQNGFCFAVNLDSLRGQNQTQNSGISLASVSCYYEGYMGAVPKTSANAAETVTLDTFLLHDVLYVIDQNGTMSVRW